LTASRARRRRIAHPARIVFLEVLSETGARRDPAAERVPLPHRQAVEGGSGNASVSVRLIHWAPGCNAAAGAGHVAVMARNATAEEALPRELSEARFSRLYRDHEREILRYALRRSADPQDAADIVAETFLVAWRRLGEVPVDDEARLWLYATARRVLANHQRGIKRRTRLAERLREELRKQLPLQAAAERPVLDALATMSDADRELLMLVGMEGLSPHPTSSSAASSARAPE
jgi:RNA polymerase sigma factor (sigma-70 family)